MIGALIGPVANLVGTWFQNKVEKTKAEGAVKVAEAKARASVAEKVAAGEVEWESTMAAHSGREYVQEGFVVLGQLPDYYQHLLYIAISASFGIKGVGQAAKMFSKK